MGRPVMGLALRERLGDEGSMALTDYVEMYGDDWKAEVLKDCAQRLDLRLATLVSREEFVQGMANLRLAMKDDLVGGLTDLRQEMTANRIEWKQELFAFRQDMTTALSSQRVELLRWSFLFWVGQVAATAGLISVALHFAR